MPDLYQTDQLSMLVHPVHLTAQTEGTVCS